VPRKTQRTALSDEKRSNLNTTDDLWRRHLTPNLIAARFETLQMKTCEKSEWEREREKDGWKGTPPPPHNTKSTFSKFGPTAKKKRNTQVFFKKGGGKGRKKKKGGKEPPPPPQLQTFTLRNLCTACKTIRQPDVRLQQCVCDLLLKSIYSTQNYTPNTSIF